MSTLNTDFQALVARFEEGVSADPTSKMSPEDAAKWKAMNEEHGDKFKTANFQTTYKPLITNLNTLKNDLARQPFVQYAHWGLWETDQEPGARKLNVWRDDTTPAVFSTLNVAPTSLAEAAKVTAWLKTNARRYNVKRMKVMDKPDPKKRGANEYHIYIMLADLGASVPRNAAEGELSAFRRAGQPARLPKTLAVMKEAGVKLAAVKLRIPSGTRVVVKANPASRRLYTGLPADGSEGEVSAVSFGSTKRTFLPGPGGGMVYIKFDNGEFMGVSPNDLDKAPKAKTSGKRAENSLEVLAALNLELTAASLPGVGLDKDSAVLEEIAKLAALDRAADQMIGRTILEQMGGQRRLSVMLGVQQIVLLNDGVSIKWPNKQTSKGNNVEIRLNGSDLYDVTFFSVGRGAKRPVKKYDDVYAEDLVSIFERQTGWYLRMASEQAHLLAKAAKGWTPPKLNSELARLVSKNNKTWGPSVFRTLDDIRDAIGKAVANDMSMADRVEHQSAIKEWKKTLSDDAVRTFFRQVEKLKSPKSRGSDEWLSGMKSAGATGPDPKGRNWKKLENPTRWMWGGMRHDVSFTVFEKPGPGIPIYILHVLNDHGMFKHTNPSQWKTPEDAFKVAAKWFPIFMGEGISLDMRTNWSKVGSGDEQMARFEEGKPADPTKNMSPEDAAEWKKQNEANKDKFKTAGISVGHMKDGDQQTFSAEGVYAHVWFDLQDARNDFGGRATAGEWQVIISTSPDPLNLKPRGRELARQVFRYVEKKAVNLVASSASDFIRQSLFKYRGKTADLGDGILAEGCPDNLDEGECAEWEANTEKYKDVVKDKNALHPIPSPDKAGDEPDEDIEKTAYDEQDATDRLEELAGGTRGAFKMLDLWKRATQATSGNRYTLGETTTTEEVFIKAARRERFSDKAIAFYLEEIQGVRLPRNWKKLGYDEGSRVPDGWDNGHIDGEKPTDEPGEEGSDVPDGSGNQKKRAAELQKGDKVKLSPTTLKKVQGDKDVFKKMTGVVTKLLDWAGYIAEVEWTGAPENFPKTNGKYVERVKGGDVTKMAAAEVIEEMYALVTPDGYMLGATDDWGDARSKSFWRHFVDDEHVAESKLMTLVNVPLALAEKFKDMGTRAQMFDDGYSAWTAARRFTKGSGARLAARAPTGLYGHTRRIQADCDGCIGRVQKSAARIAKAAYGRNEQVAEFLSVHAKRANSLPAKILVAALKGMGPRVASAAAAAEAREDRLAELRLAKLGLTAQTIVSKLGSTPVTLASIAPQGVHFAEAITAAENLHKFGFAQFDGVRIAKVTDADAQTGEGIEETDKTAGAGTTKIKADAKVGDTIEFSGGKAKITKVTGSGVEVALLDSRNKVTDETDMVKWGDIKTLSTKTAEKTAASSGASNAKYLNSIPAPKKIQILKAVAKHYGISDTAAWDEVTDRDAEALYEYIPGGMAHEVHRDFQRMHLASDKTAGARTYGLYGYAEKVASLGLQACTDLRHEAGRHAFDLHSRRAEHHASISDYFNNHSKQARCMYSRLLAASYPAQGSKVAKATLPRSVQAWLEWSE